MKPETKNSMEDARRPDGRFGPQDRVEVVALSQPLSGPDVELNEVSGRWVKSGGQSSSGPWTRVVNSAGTRPFGGLRFTPASNPGRAPYVALVDDARVLVVNSREDFVKAFCVYPPEWGSTGLDFEAIANDFDAVYVTHKGAHENREVDDADMFGDLQDWDRSEVVVLNEDALVNA